MVVNAGCGKFRASLCLCEVHRDVYRAVRWIQRLCRCECMNSPVDVLMRTDGSDGWSGDECERESGANCRRVTRDVVQLDSDL